MKKEITCTIAALGFIVGGGTVATYNADSDYICGQTTPLAMNFANEFTQDIIDSEKIESLTFSIDCKTNLDNERAYCTQGCVYGTSNGEFMMRSFADIVAADSPEFTEVQKQDSICSEITVGSNENPLNYDIQNDVTIEWTWITVEKLSMYEMSVTLTDGNTYPVSMDDDYYTIEIAEVMEEEKSVSVPADNARCYPFGNDENFCITSTYGEDRGGDGHLAWDLVPVDDGVETIYAVESGTVDFAGWENPDDYGQGFGLYVRIANDTGDKWFYYGHNSEIYVSEGQYVTAGTPIAKMGNTGYSFGEHCHLEIRDSGDYGNKLSPAEYFGLPDEYGEVRVVDENPVEETDLAVKCLSVMKYFEVGNLGTAGINHDDSGAVSLGICQWRGSNAKRMLKYLYVNNLKEYNDIANKYDKNFIWMLWDSDTSWESHSISEGSLEEQFYKELLTTDKNIELQYEYGIRYMNKIIDDAHENGINDDKVIELFVRLYNVLPFGGTAQEFRNTAPNFETACNLVNNDTHTNRHDELIDMVSNQSFEIVTVDSLKGER